MKFHERPTILQELTLESYSFERCKWMTKTIVTDSVVLALTAEQAVAIIHAFAFLAAGVDKPGAAGVAITRQIEAQLESLAESERSGNVE